MTPKAAASRLARRSRALGARAVTRLMAILSALSLGPRQLAVALLVFCLVLAPLPLASAHDPLALSGAEAERHAAMMAQEIAEHGHSHDDGDPHEPEAGHLHGHDPADHSHQIGFFGVSSSQLALPALQRWPSVQAEFPDPATGFGIERPPKQAMSL